MTAVNTSSIPSLKLCDVRSEEHFPHNELVCHGTKVYRYNSLGFRGEEFRPEAKFRVAAFGCSIAFGMGLDMEETFLHKLKLHIANSLGFTPDEVNLMVFAVGGHSNDFALRTVLNYAVEVKPDLVIYNLVAMPRTELISRDGARNLNVGAITAENIDFIDDDKLLAFFDLYEPEYGFVNAAKNIVLAQLYLQRAGIPSLVVNGTVNVEQFRNHSMCADYIRQLDFDNYIEHSFIKHKADLAADDNHAGAITNSAIALHIFPALARVFRNNGREEWAEKFASAAEIAQAGSAEYAYSMSIVYEGRGDRSGALEAIRKAVELTPEDELCQSRLAALQQA